MTLSASTSYRLTSNLSFNSVLGQPSMSAFISIEADHVQLDLNGFSILCSNVLTGQPCTGSPTGTDGIYVTGGQARIRNGSFRGIPRTAISRGFPGGAHGTHVEDVRMSNIGFRGVEVGHRAHIRSSTISVCGDTGITAGEESVVVGNRVRECGNSGFFIGRRSRVQDNVSAFNGGQGFTVFDDSLVQGNVASTNGLAGFQLTVTNIGVVPGGLARENVATGNASFGLSIIGDWVFSDNVIQLNNSGGSQTSGGVQGTGNVCGTTPGCP
ncbi:MAG TPA: right-handed parallel beta-helix repeat-containing protein [Deltaproteobacteria bacterium]|nr:right-handed parallel beta-helix repeat-containing protein [Deltaproteobacteria bacterium]